MFASLSFVFFFLFCLRALIQGSLASDKKFMKFIRQSLKNDNIVVEVPAYIKGDKHIPSPSIRVVVNAHHSKKELEQVACSLKKV